MDMIGISRDIKYSMVSILMGAAPTEYCLHRWKPRASRTFLNTSIFASDQPHGTDSLQNSILRSISHTHSFLLLEKVLVSLQAFPLGPISKDLLEPSHSGPHLLHSLHDLLIHTDRWVHIIVII